MAIDVNLLLDQANTVTTNQDTNYIEVEGGLWMLARYIGGAMSGGSTTCNIYIQQSVDVGANYYSAGKFQALGPTNDNIEMEIAVYIMLPTTATNKTRVRAHYVVTGGSPSYVTTLLSLTPFLVNGSRGSDKLNAIGTYALVAAT